MKKRTNGERGLWIWAFLGAVILGSVVVALFRAPVSSERSGGAIKPVTVPNIVLKRVVSNDAALVDKTPLFLPTEFNTAAKEIILPKSGGVFSDFPAIFAFSEVDVGFGGMRPTEFIAVSDALDLAGAGPVAFGFGRGAARPTMIDKRGAYLEIFAGKDGARVFREALTSAQPTSGSIWQPIEFMAIVGSAGLSGPLIPIVRSGLDEVDVYFSDFLVRKFKLGEKLAPGTYRLIVGP
jgi:hypothetical protein